MEYGFASAAVASGWSGYFQSLLSGIGIHLPQALTSAFNPANGTYFDVTASIITLIIAFLLTRGVKEATRANGVMVAIKLVVVLILSALVCSMYNRITGHRFCRSAGEG